MKLKSILSLVALMWAAISYAQETFKSCYVQGDSCYTVTYSTSGGSQDFSSRHVLYRMPSSAPKTLPRLGTNPQFGTLKNYTTTQEVYDHLKGAYKANEKGNAAELDKLWRAMGYTGFNDNAFTVDDVTVTYYNPGVTGVIGAGGNTYLYAKIYNDGTGKPLKGYKINAPDGNGITIMEICGNAFYQPSPPSKGYQVVSTKACKINEDLTNKSVSSFMKDGKCFLRICDKVPGSNDAPKVVNLNHDQQFGPMTDLKTADEVYSRIQSLHKENKNGNRRELDRLLKTVGYEGGVNDSDFSASSISVVDYKGGVAARMGNNDHQYMFSEIATPTYDNLRGFRIKSLNDECDLVIIDVCGNALYCPEPINCKTIECGCD